MQNINNKTIDSNQEGASQVQWSKLLIKQDQYVHHEDQSEYQQRQRLKNLYKKQLENIIQEHRKNRGNQKQEDRKIVEYSRRLDQSRLKQQLKKKQQLQRLQQKFTYDNLSQIQNHRQKHRMETQGTHQFYNHKYSRLQTQIEQQNQMRYKKRQNDKRNLASAYQDQISQHSNKKIMEKYENQKIVQLMTELEEKKQRQRQKHFNKIRNYHQNPEIYQNYKQVLNSRQRNRSQFLEKMGSFDRANQRERKKTLQNSEKQKKKREVSNFNLKYNESMKMKQRHQSLQETSDYQQNLTRLQEQLRYEKYEKLKEEQRRKNELKLELEHQIQDFEKRKRVSNKLNNKEYLLNKSDQIPALPGLKKDHASIKQQKILQNFLRGRSDYQ